jgi:hypothetical protein
MNDGNQIGDVDLSVLGCAGDVLIGRMPPDNDQLSGGLWNPQESRGGNRLLPRNSGHAPMARAGTK